MLTNGMDGVLASSAEDGGRTSSSAPVPHSDSNLDMKKGKLKVTAWNLVDEISPNFNGKS